MRNPLLPIVPLFLAMMTPTAAAQTDPETEGWYVFQGSGHAEGSVVMLGEDWLPRPAGDQGRPMIDGDKLVIDGEPVKFWGINDNFGATTPPKETAGKRAKFYSRLGFNLVRLHKSGNPSALMDAEKSITAFKPDALDRFDYYTNRLREEGVYFAFSLQFKSDFGPEDLDEIPAAEEIFEISTKDGKTQVKGNAYGLMYVSPEMQDLLIGQLVKLLKHESEYAGMPYAGNPALAYVEIINEDNMYFYHAVNRIAKTPYYKKRLAEMFSDWLTEKYGSAEKLREAWGEKAFNTQGEEFGFADESLEARNLFPVAGPWVLTEESLEGPLKQRTLDSALFYRVLQDRFYDKAVKAIREAGFEGPIIASNWISRSTLGELHNLYSDAQVGIIDRHNYHTGQVSKHWQPVKGEFNNTSMLPQPGGSLLSSGYLQVLNRPFMLSEWIHAFPNEWAVEGPAVIGAYGMGLQGWDLSTIFSQSGSADFSRNMHSSKWDGVKPNMGVILPAIARQVLRGDVEEAEPIAAIHVTPEQLEKGELPIELEIKEDWDVKSYNSEKIPTEALAIGRVGVSFTEGDTPGVDPSEHRKDGGFVSTTEQLKWVPGENARSGYFLIDTPGTRAAVGFLPNEPLELSGLTITPDDNYAAIYVTDLTRRKSDKGRYLVTAVARARNAGMQIEMAGEGLPRMKDFGSKNEVLMEPVKAAIKVTDDNKIGKVTVLDHGGVPTDKTVSVTDNAFMIDGTRDQTMFYLLEYTGKLD